MEDSSTLGHSLENQYPGLERVSNLIVENFQDLQHLAESISQIPTPVSTSTAWEEALSPLRESQKSLKTDSPVISPEVITQTARGVQSVIENLMPHIESGHAWSQKAHEILIQGIPLLDAIKERLTEIHSFSKGLPPEEIARKQGLQQLILWETQQNNLIVPLHLQLENLRIIHQSAQENITTEEAALNAAKALSIAGQATGELIQAGEQAGQVAFEVMEMYRLQAVNSGKTTNDWVKKSWERRLQIEFSEGDLDQIIASRQELVEIFQKGSSDVGAHMEQSHKNTDALMESSKTLIKALSHKKPSHS